MNQNDCPFVKRKMSVDVAEENTICYYHQSEVTLSPATAVFSITDHQTLHILLFVFVVVL